MKPTADSLSAVIHGLQDGDVFASFNYPGFNSHLIHQSLGNHTVSINEKTAFEEAYGVSLSGKRSVVSFKGVGLTSCTDQYLHSVIVGVNAGMVIILTEDLDMISSPESQDTRSIQDIFGGLWLEPSSVEDGYLFCKNAFSWSEELDIPIVIRLTNTYFKNTGIHTRRTPDKDTSKPLAKNRDKYVYWKGKDDLVKNKVIKIQKFVETNKDIFSSLHTSNSQKKTISFGSIIKKGVFVDSSHLNLKSIPFPVSIVKSFISQSNHLKVIESGNPILALKIRALQSDLIIAFDNQKQIDTSSESHPRDYLPKFFEALKIANVDFVIGDEGLFTDDLTESVDCCLCMGSSVGIGVGLSIGGVKSLMVVIGDGSFMHGAISSMVEALSRNISMIVVIVDNQGLQTTGGQTIQGKLETSLCPYDKEEIDYEYATKEDFVKIINKLKIKAGLKVLVVKSKK